MASSRDSSFSVRPKRLTSIILLSSLLGLILHGLISAYPAPLENSERTESLSDYMARSPVRIPATWIELDRKPSPDGVLDAVVVTGSVYPRENLPDNLWEQSIRTRRPMNPGCTCVKIVSKGERIPPVAPYRWASQFADRVESKAPFVANHADAIAVEWLDDRTLQVRAKVKTVLVGERFFEAWTGSTSYPVTIQYRVEHNSMNSWVSD